MPIGPLAMAGAGAGMQLFSNLITGAINDKRQLKQQSKLNEQAKEMTDYNLSKQMEMWERTGYKPQMDMMKKAGLNPALMYGHGAQSGSTAVSTAQGQGAPNEATKGVNMAESLGMGMQMELLKAQKENIQADTEKKKIDAAKTAGIDTDLDKAQLELVNLDIKVNENTLWERINEIVSRSIEQQEKGVQAGVEREVAEATKEDQIKKVKAEAVNLGIQKLVMEKGLELTQAQIDKIAMDIVQRAEEIKIQQGYLDIEKFVSGFNNDWGTIIGRGAVDAIKGLIQMLPFMKFLPKQQGRTEVKGFQPSGQKRY